MIPLAAGRPYLPGLAIQWYRDTPEARWRAMEGSMVFIDVSGFTSMSERLARQGRIGAEEVTAVISATFDALLGVAFELGGSLLKFGGDAQLIFFTGPGHQARAAAAALGMRARLRQIGRFETSAGRVTLRMSAGAHSGRFHFFLVGSSHRELIVAGPAASTTVTMEAAAAAGQILMSPALAASLPPANSGTALGPGVLLRGIPPASPGISATAPDSVAAAADFDVTALIPQALRPMVMEAASPEHRPVTVAFIHFHGVDAVIDTAGADAAATALDQLVRSVQAAAERHQVAFLATDIAPDGGKIILCAGAPNATGSDEEHMLLTLHEIATADVSLPIQVGVNRGPVFAGEVGPSHRRTYTVMGDAVNLAARLMAKAETSQIVASRAVIDVSRRRFAVTELEPFTVKGKQRPVHAYAVSGPLESRITATDANLPMLGRSAELSVLLAAWEDARRGAGRLVEITAEPGMGKSRLTQEFLAIADPPRLLRGELRVYQTATPYFAVKEVLREALGLGGLDDAAAATGLTDLVARRAPQLQSWLSLIGVPMHLELAESPGAAMLQEEYRRPRLEEAVDELLAAVLQEPLILLLEDAQWMDDASRDLLVRLASRVGARPWLICVTRHPGSQGFAAPDETEATRIALLPLGAEEASALIAAAAGDSPLLPHQIDSLVMRARGNPLFLIELVRALQRGEAFESLPHSVEGMIHARIDQLAPRDRTALRHLAVLGVGFEIQHAGVVLSEWDAPRQVLQRLGDFLAIDAGGWCEFHHSLIREVAYSGLPYRSRRELHGRVAESVQRDPASDARTALLSIHYFHAGRWWEAWVHSREAGDKAKRRYANVEGATFYERALAAARRAETVPPADRAAVAEALGHVYDLSGRYDEAGREYRAARHLVADPLDAARLRLKEAWIEEKRGRYSQALRWLTLGYKEIDSLEGTAAEAVRAQLSVWRSAMRLLQGRFGDAVEWAERAMEAAERGRDRDALAHALYLHDAAQVYLGRTVDESYSRRALAIYEELDDLPGQAIVANNLAGFAYFAGRWSDAVGLYQRSREARLRSGDPVEAVRAGAGIGEILCDQGDLEGARATLDEALAVWRAARYPFGVAFVTSQLGRVAVRDGRFDDGERLYHEAMALYTDLKARSDILETETRLVESLVYQGRSAEALARLQHAAGLAAELGGDPVQLVRLHLLRGYAAAQRGLLADAQRELAASLEAARKRDAPYDIALALEALARIGRAAGRPDWHEGLDEAWAIYDRLGVVSVPQVPLKGEDAAAASSPST